MSSWTSSYRKHSSANRVYNVTKLCGIINGQTLEPGVEWSINEVAGPRTVANGWKEADGISDGGYTKQAGGGVCQISSTLFNASIRSGIFYNSRTSISESENSYKWGIEVTFWRHHSIISNYIPLGLDATISTGGPDFDAAQPLHDAILYRIVHEYGGEMRYGGDLRADRGTPRIWRSNLELYL